MADCKAPTPPSPTDPNADWVAYTVAFAEYLECLELNQSSTAIATYATEFADFKTAVVAWQNHIGP